MDVGDRLRAAYARERTRLLRQHTPLLAPLLELVAAYAAPDDLMEIPVGAWLLHEMAQRDVEDRIREQLTRTEHALTGMALSGLSRMTLTVQVFDREPTPADTCVWAALVEFLRERRVRWTHAESFQGRVQLRLLAFPPVQLGLESPWAAPQAHPPPTSPPPARDGRGRKRRAQASPRGAPGEGGGAAAGPAGEQ